MALQPHVRIMSRPRAHPDSEQNVAHIARRYGLLPLLCIGLLLAQAQAECLITLGYNDDPIPPYIERPVPSAGPQGCAIQLVTQAARELKCLIVWQRLPNLRVLHETIHQQTDGALLYSWTGERSKALVYPQRNGALDASRRVTTLNYMLYRRQGSNLDWDGQALTPAACVVGFNRGWSIGSYLDEQAIPHSSGNDSEHNLKRLEKGRICAYATLEESGDAAIAHFPGRFEKLPIPLLRKDYFVVFNPFYYQQHSQQVEQLWNKIGQLRDSALSPRKTESN
jgi:polar amino acid transport system substrate-binding protein